MVKFIVLAILLLPHSLVSRASVSPSGSLTLDTALAEAASRNPGIVSAQAGVDEATWRRLEALSGFIPRIGLSANHLFDVRYQIIDLPTGASFDAVYPKTLLTVSAQWTFFDGLETWNSVSGAGDAKRAAEKDLERARFLLDAEVKLRFYQSLAAEGLRLVAEQNVKTLQEHFSRTRELLAQGQATRFDLLRTQTQLEEAEPEALRAEDDLTSARIALARAMGEAAEERPISGVLPDPPSDAAPFTADRLKLDPSARGDIEALVSRAEAADRAHTASLGSWYPRLALGASEDFYNNINFSLNDGYRKAYSVGVYMTWNLFDGGASLARQNESAARAVQADAQARTAQLRLPGELETWRRRLLYNMALFRARKQAIESARESVRLAKLGFGAGTRTNTDVLDAELDLFRASAGKIRAQIESLEALLSLELTLGRTFGKGTPQ